MHRAQKRARDPDCSAISCPPERGSPFAGECLSSAFTDRAPGEAATTILVVEDDHAVRLLFTRVLETAGYRVIACENGTTGLAAARLQIDRISAIVTDAKMPGMSGETLIARIRSLRPELPAIVVSGNTLDGVSDSATVFLAKPVSPGKLTAELERLLCGTM
ncbi:MAG TPA: response regulator [Acidobacteriaceae bacterium]|nr:response regulator [Acidobacteriaceae bacterium]